MAVAHFWCANAPWVTRLEVAMDPMAAASKQGSSSFGIILHGAGGMIVDVLPADAT